MKCEKCGKNQASIFTKKLIDGEDKEVYICAQCAGENGVNDDLSVFFEDEREKVCQCGTTFSEIKQSGFVGCPQCYQTFKQELLPIISSLQGCVVNHGKRPLTKIERLEKQIDDAIANHFYELAVKLNEELAKLKEEKQ